MGSRNDINCSHCHPASSGSPAQPCAEHHHRAHVSPLRSFHFTGRSIDWRTLHGVDLDTLVRTQAIVVYKLAVGHLHVANNLC